MKKFLRLVLNDYHATLDEMLDTLNENTIHQQCIDRLLTEVYKLLNGYSPDIMNDVFSLRENTYNFRNFHVLLLMCLEIIACATPSFIEQINYGKSCLKNSCSLEQFKKELKNWRCTRCPCQICSRFIADVGYIS